MEEGHEVNGGREYTIQLTNTRRVNKPHTECKQLLWFEVAPAHGDGTSIYAITISLITKQTKILSQSDFPSFSSTPTHVGQQKNMTFKNER